MHSAVYGTRTTVHHWYPDLSDKQTIGGLKHTTVFHKSSKTNRHQALKHLRQYRYCGNRSVIGNRKVRWTFGNWVTFSCLQLTGNIIVSANHRGRRAQWTSLYQPITEVGGRIEPHCISQSQRSAGAVNLLCPTISEVGGRRSYSQFWYRNCQEFTNFNMNKVSLIERRLTCCCRVQLVRSCYHR